MTFHLTIPSRNEAIREHRSSGGSIAAVFPVHYPRALLRAYGILPVEMWGPPGVDLTLGDAHLQSYTCGIARHGLSFLLGGGHDKVDMVLAPHCCDTLQGLSSILRDFVAPRKPTFMLY
ncbi:MAG: 2-hydroxyacyl-CoA dehydratase, partial [bacterium]|nr:2-hydroxyacyl-CoA dehydratase [bacterium]